MAAFPAAFLDHLMPALCSAVGSSQPSLSDCRFFCLRTMSDCLALFLTSPDAGLAADSGQRGGPASSGEGLGSSSGGGEAGRSSSGGGGDGQQSEVAAALDVLLRQHVVPLVPVLLQQDEPMPLYALKVCVMRAGAESSGLHSRQWGDALVALASRQAPCRTHHTCPDTSITPHHTQLLGGILEVDGRYVAVVEDLSLSATFFEFLSLEHPNNNVHNIRLCRQLMLAGCLSHAQLLELRAADKVCCGGGGGGPQLGVVLLRVPGLRGSH
jgi:serine/threonine-protein kinase ULK4